MYLRRSPFFQRHRQPGRTSVRYHTRRSSCQVGRPASLTTTRRTHGYPHLSAPHRFRRPHSFARTCLFGKCGDSHSGSRWRRRWAIVRLVILTASCLHRHCPFSFFSPILTAFSPAFLCACRRYSPPFRFPLNPSESPHVLELSTSSTIPQYSFPPITLPYHTPKNDAPISSISSGHKTTVSGWYQPLWDVIMGQLVPIFRMLLFFVARKSDRVQSQTLTQITS